MLHVEQHGADTLVLVLGILEEIEAGKTLVDREQLARLAQRHGNRADFLDAVIPDIPIRIEQRLRRLESMIERGLEFLDALLGTLGASDE